VRENAGVSVEPVPPSEADGAATWVAEVGSTARAEVRRAPRWRRILRAIGLLGAGGLAMVGFFRERSLDLALDGELPHFGLHGQQLPHAWICPEGHQHYSIPYWMGGLLVALPAAALGLVRPLKSRTPLESR
jgi:hypothetical protein